MTWEEKFKKIASIKINHIQNYDIKLKHTDGPVLEWYVYAGDNGTKYWIEDETGMGTFTGRGANPESAINDYWNQLTNARVIIEVEFKEEGTEHVIAVINYVDGEFVVTRPDTSQAIRPNLTKRVQRSSRSLQRALTKRKPPVDVKRWVAFSPQKG